MGEIAEITITSAADDVLYIIAPAYNEEETIETFIDDWYPDSQRKHAGRNRGGKAGGNLPVHLGGTDQIDNEAPGSVGLPVAPAAHSLEHGAVSNELRRVTGPLPIQTYGQLLRFLDVFGIRGLLSYRNFGEESQSLVIAYTKEQGDYWEEWENIQVATGPDGSKEK